MLAAAAESCTLPAVEPWANTDAAIREAGDLTRVDLSRIHARRSGAAAVGIGGFALLVIGSLFIANNLAGLGTVGLTIDFMTTAGIGLWAMLAWRRRVDITTASRVRSLGARRREEAQAARTIGALGAGESVAVPGIVDERVREARR